jgi:hypothetical protein
VHGRWAWAIFDQAGRSAAPPRGRDRVKSGDGAIQVPELLRGEGGPAKTISATPRNRSPSRTPPCSVARRRVDRKGEGVGVGTRCEVHGVPAAC